MFLGSFLVAIPNAKQTNTETNRIQLSSADGKSEGKQNEDTKGCISNESCVINVVSDVPSARETTTICLNRYNTKKKKRRRRQQKDVKDVERNGWTNNLKRSNR